MVPSYCHPTAFKTTASALTILELVDQVFGGEEAVKKFDMTVNLEVKRMLKERVARFLPNPEKNWGPKSASKIKLTVV